MSEINQDIISKKSLKKRQKQIKKYKNEIKLNQDQEEVSKNKFDLNCNSINDLPNKFIIISDSRKYSKDSSNLSTSNEDYSDYDIHPSSQKTSGINNSNFKGKASDFKIKYKTELCKFYEMTGRCKYGENCAYAHGIENLRSKVTNTTAYRTKKCIQFFDNGYCPYGSRCQFKHQLKDNIERDMNRANIIIWSIANETPQNEKRDKFLTNLSIYARSLDNTRLISMAMNFLRSKKTNEFIIEDNMIKYLDIISLNEYIGWYRRVKDFSNITFIIPYEKPVIISEFGGGAKYNFHGDKNQRWTEEFQEYVYKQNLLMFDKIKELAGLTPWILKDFRSSRRVLSGIQDYYNMKGLVSDNGDKKKLFTLLKIFMKIKRKDGNKNLF